MAYKEGSGGGGRVLQNSFAIVSQTCGQCGWAGQKQDGYLVQESFGVNEYLVKPKPRCSVRYPLRLRWDRLIFAFV